jgi:uncharacterized protein
MKEHLDKNVNWKRLNDYVKESLKYDENGHDYEHIKRVLKIALKIADSLSGVDYDILVASCLFHDIANRDGRLIDHHLASAEEAFAIAPLLGFSEEKARKIKIAIEDHVTFTNSPKRPLGMQIESQILRDAHNLDNLGSFGLVKRIILASKDKIPIFESKNDNLNESIYGHIKFLTNLPGEMLTQEGRKMAEERVKILREFVAGIEKESN